MSDIDLFTGLPQDETGDKPYLQFGNQYQTAGIRSTMYQNVDFNIMSWPQSLLTQALANGTLTAVLPNPIAGYRILLPDGDTTNAALAFTEAAEQNSGLLRVGVNDHGWEIGGSLVTEWKASEFRVNYLGDGQVVFPDNNAKLTGSSLLFWDRANSYLGVGNNDPVYRLEVRDPARPPLAISQDDNNWATFQTTGDVFTVHGYGVTYGETVTYNFQSDVSGQTIELSVYNTHVGGASSNAMLMAQVADPTSGDPYSRYYVVGATVWSQGLDNSDSDKFKISKNATLGTNDYFTIDTAGSWYSQNGSLTWDNANAILKDAGELRVGTTTDTSDPGDLASGSSTALYGMWFASNVTTGNAQNSPAFGMGISRSTVTTSLGLNGWGMFSLYTEAEDSNVAIGEYRGTINGGFYWRGRRARPTTLTTQTDDFLAGFYGHGYNAAGTPADSVAVQIDMAQDASATGTGVPGRLTISTASTAGTPTERLRIDSSGYFGLSTTGGQAIGTAGGWNTHLVIANTGGSEGITIVGSTTSTLNAVKFGDGGNYDQGFIGYSHNTDTLFLGANVTTAMTISSAGAIEQTSTSGAFSFWKMTRTSVSRTFAWALDGGAAYFGNTTDGSLDIAIYHNAGGGIVFNESQADRDFRVEGDSASHMIFMDATSTTENIALLTTSAPNWQSGDKILFIGNADTVPTGDPTGGGFLYVEAGALKFRGSSGTVTPIAPA